MLDPDMYTICVFEQLEFDDARLLSSADDSR